MIPGLGRSPGEGKGDPLQCSGLENSMDEESDMTEQLLFSLSQVLEDHLERWERGDRILMGNCFYFRMVSGASPLSQAEDEWFYVHCFPQRASDKWWADPCPL